jgi:hypothetical protein
MENQSRASAAAARDAARATREATEALGEGACGCADAVARAGGVGSNQARPTATQTRAQGPTADFGEATRKADGEPSPTALPAPRSRAATPGPTAPVRRARRDKAAPARAPMPRRDVRIRDAASGAFSPRRDVAAAGNARSVASRAKPRGANALPRRD